MNVVSLLVWLFLGWTVVSAVVYYDARRNSSRSAGLWALAVLVGGLLGIVLYALLGRDEAEPTPSAPDGSRSEDVAECPECHGLETVGRGTCRFCGADLS